MVEIMLRVENTTELRNSVALWKNNGISDKVAMNTLKLKKDLLTLKSVPYAPSMKVPAMYVAFFSILGSVVVGLLFGGFINFTTLIIGLSISLFALSGEPHRYPKVRYWTFVRALRKYGYDGYTEYIGGTK